MRGFPKAELRDSMRSQLYDGKLWKDSLEAEVMPMIEDYSNVHIMKPIDFSKIK